MKGIWYKTKIMILAGAWEGGRYGVRYVGGWDSNPPTAPSSIALKTSSCSYSSDISREVTVISELFTRQLNANYLPH